MELGGEPGVVFVNSINVCFDEGGGTPAPKFNVMKLDDREVSGVAPPLPRRRMEGSSVDPTMIVSVFLNMRMMPKHVMQNKDER